MGNTDGKYTGVSCGSHVGTLRGNTHGPLRYLLDFCFTYSRHMWHKYIPWSGCVPNHSQVKMSKVKKCFHVSTVDRGLFCRFGICGKIKSTKKRMMLCISFPGNLCGVNRSPHYFLYNVIYIYIHISHVFFRKFGCDKWWLVDVISYHDE